MDSSPWSKKRAVVVAPPPPPAADPAPVATQRFELASDDEDIVGVVQVTKASKEDTLTDIARRFNVGYEEIVRANPDVDPWVPGEGREVIVPTRYILPNAPRTGVVINVAAMRLFYFEPREKNQPQVVYTYPIGIGKVGWATPEGVTKVTRRKKDPTWTPPVSVRREHRKNGEDLPAVVGPGPDNPLGRHALYLGWPSYLVHGTNKPAGVGLRSSHGCIRLFPEDIAALFEQVPNGAAVRVVNQPFVFGWHAGELHLQAYDVLEDDPRDWQKARRKLLSRALADRIEKKLKERGETVDWEVISKIAHEPHGIPVAIVAGEASLEQLVAAAPRVRNEVPAGATWDGASDLPVDEAEFRELLSDRDPQSPGPSARKPATP
ncbi:MAG: L,D-transpeptidase family protein [Proteobacteria bacterium]|nr:L,D-transpeptidase family protein [Pseudomonadota bacterium]